MVENRRLRRQLHLEQLNGESIMECRDYIAQKLGANAATINGVTSPFFDDLVKATVNKLLMTQQAYAALMQQAQNLGQTAQTGSYYAGTTNATNTLHSLSLTQTSASGGGTTSVWVPFGSGTVGYPPAPDEDMRYRVQDGRPTILVLPDGTLIDVKADGSFEIKDSDAKVIYRASRVREFNRFINASDLLEDFIRYCHREASVRRGEMLKLPIELFIGWLILEAARADQEPPPAEVKLIPELRKHAAPRCLVCNRYLHLDRYRAGVLFCNRKCFQRAEGKINAEAAKDKIATQPNPRRQAHRGLHPALSHEKKALPGGAGSRARTHVPAGAKIRKRNQPGRAQCAADHRQNS